MTREVGVIEPAQIPKRYSRLRPESFPPSAQAADNFRTQAHKSPKTVLIPIGSDFPHFAFDPHKENHSLESQFAIGWQRLRRRGSYERVCVTPDSRSPAVGIHSARPGDLFNATDDWN